MIDFLDDVDLVEGIQIHKVFVMLHYLFVHQMLSSKIQTKIETNNVINNKEKFFFQKVLF